MPVFAGFLLAIALLGLWRAFWFIASIWLSPWDLPRWAQRLFKVTP